MRQIHGKLKILSKKELTLMSNPILVTVRYTVKDGKREEFYRHIVEQGIDTASRA